MVAAAILAARLVMVGGHCFVRTTTPQQAQSSPGLDPQSQAELAQIIGGAAQQASGSQTVGTVTGLVSGLLGMRHARPTPTPQPPISIVSALIENQGHISSKPATLEVDYSDRVPDLLAIPALHPGSRVDISHVVMGEQQDGPVACEVTR